MFRLFVFTFALTGCLYGEEIERMVVPQGQPFSFDCQDDESVYFGKQLDKWSELQNSDLNLNFRYLTKENTLRVTSEAAQANQVGFYACRKATWTSTSMNIIYQLILAGKQCAYLSLLILNSDPFLSLAEIHSFYWNYICHAPLGSCERVDDRIDESRSSFAVADESDVELFCCASTTGYDKVEIQMSQVGNYRASIELKRRQEPEGSSVVCAEQRTRFRRTPYQQQETLTCELVIDGRRHSMLSSVIFIQGLFFISTTEMSNKVARCLDAVLPALPPPPPPRRFSNPPWNYNPYVANNQDKMFLPRRNAAPSERKLTSGVSLRWSPEKRYKLLSTHIVLQKRRLPLLLVPLLVVVFYSL